MQNGFENCASKRTKVTKEELSRMLACMLIPGKSFGQDPEGTWLPYHREHR